MTVRIINGECRSELAKLEAESVDCVITSPPYWGLRSYGKDEGMIGLEKTLPEWVASLVATFREIRRVLKSTGTLWLNVGDAYSTAGYRAHKGDPKSFEPSSWSRDRRAQDAMNTAAGSGLQPKQRLMLPARLAIALQEDGWFLRDEIIWRKPNPMPIPVKDRTTPAHEMVYLFSKKARYYFDAAAIAEPAERSSIVRMSQKSLAQQGGGARADHYEHERLTQKGRGRRPNVILQGLAAKAGLTPRKDGERWNENDGRGFIPQSLDRNKRSVWDVANDPLEEAHFAAFPPALIEPMILAGCPQRVCVVCGAPWLRITKRTIHPTKKAAKNHADTRDAAADDYDQGSNRAIDGHRPGMAQEIRHMGWRPTCKHGAAGYKPGLVLDPFGGAGTTGLVADRLMREAILIEINADYCRLADGRLRGDLREVEGEPIPQPNNGPLFELLDLNKPLSENSPA